MYRGGWSGLNEKRKQKADRISDLLFVGSPCWELAHKHSVFVGSLLRYRQRSDQDQRLPGSRPMQGEKAKRKDHPIGWSFVLAPPAGLEPADTSRR